MQHFFTIMGASLEWRRRQSLLALLIFPLGMAMGALLSGFLAHHHREPCTVVHQAVHSLATPPSSATSSPPPAAAVMTSLDTPPSPSDAHPSAVPSGSVAVDESLITLNAPARALFERVRPPAPLLVTFGSISMSEFVLNWVAHVQKLEGQGASHVDFAVAVLDKPLLALLDEKGLPAITLAAVDGLMEHKEYFRADEKKFLRMGEIKVDLIRPLIAAGYHVLMCDADVVIMSDPWPWVLPGLAREPAMRHRVAQMVRADVLVTTDCIDEQEDGQERHWLMNKEFNTGVLFFRGSRGALDVIDRWKKRIGEETGQQLYINDQAVFNRAFHNVGGFTPLAVPENDVPPPVAGKDPHWDRVNVRAVYHMKRIPEINESTTIGVFPMVEFLNGHSFFVAKLHEHYGATAVALHATYQFGDSPEYSYGKRERLRRAGLWAVDDHEYYTPPKLLVIKGDLLQGFSMPADYDETVDGGIDKHLAANTVQRRRLLDAFAIAITLGRTLVVPQLWCFCDRYWWLLHACRMPGAERMSMPYDCPLDHIFEPGRWVGQQLDFRPGSFVSDPRFALASAPDATRAAATATLPKGCLCAEVGATAECERDAWARLGGHAPALHDWEKEVARVAILEVQVDVLDTFCLAVPANVYNRLAGAFGMRVGFCSKELNKIPPNWKPETHPLNCSWGYDLPPALSPEMVAARAQAQLARA